MAYSVYDFVRGFDANGRLVCGVIAKVNKASYKLQNGALIKKDKAELMTDYDIDALIFEHLKPSLVMALKSAKLNEIETKKLERAYIALFGKKQLDTIKSRIKKLLGF